VSARVGKHIKSPTARAAASDPQSDFPSRHPPLDIEVAQKVLGHARRSTTEDIYDHAEAIIDENVTGLLLEAIAPDLSILQASDAIN
jgi:integrase